mmetsp:Transcript_51806/g.166841  ORF Transcript_51806/g.166841 Transcript_51806/m.166841 type:complete len:205 (-) Transcript_51806:2-616(-)
MSESEDSLLTSAEPWWWYRTLSLHGRNGSSSSAATRSSDPRRRRTASTGSTQRPASGAEPRKRPGRHCSSKAEDNACMRAIRLPPGTSLTWTSHAHTCSNAFPGMQASTPMDSCDSCSRKDLQMRAMSPAAKSNARTVLQTPASSAGQRQSQSPLAKSGPATASATAAAAAAAAAATAVTEGRREGRRISKAMLGQHPKAMLWT